MIQKILGSNIESIVNTLQMHRKRTTTIIQQIFAIFAYSCDTVLWGRREQRTCDSRKCGGHQMFDTVICCRLRRCRLMAHWSRRGFFSAQRLRLVSPKNIRFVPASGLLSSNLTILEKSNSFDNDITPCFVHLSTTNHDRTTKKKSHFYFNDFGLKTILSFKIFCGILQWWVSTTTRTSTRHMWYAAMRPFLSVKYHRLWQILCLLFRGTPIKTKRISQAAITVGPYASPNSINFICITTCLSAHVNVDFHFMKNNIGVL